MEKMAWDGPKWGQEDFVLTNPDLAGILGRADLDLENFSFLICWTQISGSQVSKFPDFQVPRFPDAAGTAGP